MNFLNGIRPSYDLTYNDVFMVPSRSGVSSRLDVDLSSPDGVGTTIPIVVANMTAVSGRRMAETVARRGAVAILPQDYDEAELRKTFGRVHPVFETPITVDPHDPVGHVRNLILKRAQGYAIVVEKDDVLGIINLADCEGVDRYTTARDIMTPDFLTLDADLDLRNAFDLLTDRHVDYAPVMDGTSLVGCMTRKGLLRSGIYSPALDPSGNLMMGVAVGINGDVRAKCDFVLGLGADVLVVDTAHGHQDRMFAALALAAAARNDFEQATGRRIPIAAGNVVAAAGAVDLIEAGADIVKVGVGPGAMCTTRMQTGVGRPQFSAVLECSDAAQQLGAHVWADGGVKYPRDVALALAGGAASVMLGSWFAGTLESTGELMHSADGRMYKESFGMASSRAVRNRSRSKGAYDRARLSLFEEGISQSKMFLDPARPGVEDLLDSITAGVRSACTYAGAASISKLHERAIVGIQAASGYDEGRPRTQSW